MLLKIKNLILNYWPLIFLIVLFVVYSYPYFFQNKIPFPSSFIANEMAPWKNYLSHGPVKNGIPDVGGEIYPMRSLVVDYFKNGWWPLWNPHIFSGTPLLANFQSAVFFPLNIIFFLLPNVDAWSLLILFQPLLAGFFVFLLCRSLSLSKTASLLSSISFAFCGYLTVWGAYGTMAYSVLFFPLVLYLIEKYLQNHKLYNLPLITITLGISFFSGHIQSWLYVFLGSLIYILVKKTFNKDITIRQTAVLLIFVLLCIPFTAVQLFPSLEFYQYSSRALAVNNIKNIGIPLQYLITLIAPDFFGNPVTRNDWFGTYAEWMGYTGLVPFFLSLVALINIRSIKNIRPFVLILLVGLILSFSGPILDLISKLPLPIISNSNPSRAISLVSFSLCILAGFGFDQFFIKDKKIQRSSIISLLIISVMSLTVVFLINTGSLFFSKDTVIKLQTVSLRNLILPIIFTIFLWIIVIVDIKKPPLKKLLVISCLLLVSFEMLRFYTKWMPFDNKLNFYPATQITEFLQKQPGYFRYYGQFGQSPAYIDKLYSVEGYEPLNLLRYSTFVDAAVSGTEKPQYNLEVRLQSREMYTKKIMNLLGIRYLIYDAGNLQDPFVFPVWDFQYPKLFDDGKYVIFENKDVFPRAFLVGNYEVNEGSKNIIPRILSDNFDAKNSVVLEEKVGGISPDTGATSEITNYFPNKITIKTNSNNNQLLLLTDNYYPGWKAYINGNETKIYRADYTFRAVYVPSGSNLVEFVYSPPSFKWGMIISMITAGIIITFFIFSIKKKI